MAAYRDPCQPCALGCRLFEHIRQWVGTESIDDDQLREISIEYEETELRAMTWNLDPARRLGSGHFGAVYRGTLRDGHDVAVKVLKVENDNIGESDCGFAEEVRVLSRFRHPNLVTLMGWGKGKGWRYLVYELLSGGDVLHRLQNCSTPSGTPFNWPDRLYVALDASCGLAHMHNSTPKAFHRDIKSANILLDRSGTAKMADFGLSGIAKNGGKLNVTCERIGGTPGYACPRYVKSGRVTEDTEVYAFGIVLLELLLNLMPACLAEGGAIVYPISQVVRPQAPGAFERAFRALDSKAHWPPALANELVDLALACSSMEYVRPHFTNICRRLRQLSEQFCGQNEPGQQQGWLARPIPPLNHQLGSQLMSREIVNQPGLPLSGRHLQFDTPPGTKSHGDFSRQQQCAGNGSKLPLDQWGPNPLKLALESGTAFASTQPGDSPGCQSTGSFAHVSNLPCIGFGPAPLEPPYPKQEPCHAHGAVENPCSRPLSDESMMSPQCQQLKQQLKQLNYKIRHQQHLATGRLRNQSPQSPQVGSPGDLDFQQSDNSQQEPFFSATKSLRQSMQQSMQQQLRRFAGPEFKAPLTLDFPPVGVMGRPKIQAH